MGITSRVTCRKCGETKNVFHSLSHYPTICAECKQIEKDDAKRAHFAELDKLTVEERLRRVEEWQYTYDRTDHTPWQLRKIG